MGSDTDTRDHLVAALHADLIGPFAAGSAGADASEEILPLPPSRWYLTGFLAPEEGRAEEADGDPETQDEVAAGPDETEEETQGQELESKRKNFLPASMGLSVFLPKGCKSISVKVSFAEYDRIKLDEEAGKGRNVWKRMPRRTIAMEVPLATAADVAALTGTHGIVVPETTGLRLVGQLRPVHEAGRALPDGTLALSIFLVNRRPPEAAGFRDRQYIFQAEMELGCAEGFVARPNLASEHSRERDENGTSLATETDPQANPMSHPIGCFVTLQG